MPNKINIIFTVFEKLFFDFNDSSFRKESSHLWMFAAIKKIISFRFFVIFFPDDAQQQTHVAFIVVDGKGFYQINIVNSKRKETRMFIDIECRCFDKEID